MFALKFPKEGLLDLRKKKEEEASLLGETGRNGMVTAEEEGKSQSHFTCARRSSSHKQNIFTVSIYLMF